MTKQLKLLKRAIRLAGGYEAFAKRLPASPRSNTPVSRATVFRVVDRLAADGGVIPAEWCPTVSVITKTPVTDIRRDVYPPHLVVAVAQ